MRTAPTAIHCQGIFCVCFRLLDFVEYFLGWLLGEADELLDCRREADFLDLVLFFDFFEPLIIDSLSGGI